MERLDERAHFLRLAARAPGLQHAPEDGCGLDAQLARGGLDLVVIDADRNHAAEDDQGQREHQHRPHAEPHAEGERPHSGGPKR